jgi:hypothetical protein
VAEGNRTTLFVALAGIAATALVGIAGTAASWLSARDDREAQRELARDERTYDRRVAVYLEAIAFVERQERAVYEYGVAVADKSGKFPAELSELGLPTHFPEPYSFRSGRIPFETGPPTTLTDRLRVFGSPSIFTAFQRTQSIVSDPSMLLATGAGLSGGVDLIPGKRNDQEWKMFRRSYNAFYDQINRLENIVHRELY